MPSAPLVTLRATGSGPRRGTMRASVLMTVVCGLGAPASVDAATAQVGSGKDPHHRASPPREHVKSI